VNGQPVEPVTVRELVDLRRRVAIRWPDAPQRILLADDYLRRLSAAPRWARILHQLQTWDLDRVDRAEIAEQLDAAEQRRALPEHDQPTSPIPRIPRPRPREGS
jgi:ribonuclease D